MEKAEQVGVLACSSVQVGSLKEQQLSLALTPMVKLYLDVGLAKAHPIEPKKR